VRSTRISSRNTYHAACVLAVTARATFAKPPRCRCRIYKMMMGGGGGGGEKKNTEKMLTDQFVVVDSGFRLAAHVPRVNDVVFVGDLFRFQRQMLNGRIHLRTRKRPTDNNTASAWGNVRTIRFVFITERYRLSMYCYRGRRIAYCRKRFTVGRTRRQMASRASPSISPRYAVTFSRTRGERVRVFGGTKRVFFVFFTFERTRVFFFVGFANGTLAHVGCREYARRLAAVKPLSTELLLLFL